MSEGGREEKEITEREREREKRSFLASYSSIDKHKPASIPDQK